MLVFDYGPAQGSAMTELSRRTLLWVPRVLSIVYIAFLSLFALDAFSEEYGFWRTLLALAIHLIPSLVLVSSLVLAWRREWIGGVLFAAAGLYYTFIVLSRHVPPATKLAWIRTIAGPAFVVAALFLANCLIRQKPRA